MIFTFRLHGQGFRPESIVLGGSTVSQSPMEKVIPSRYISPTLIEVTIDTEQFADALIHLSVLQTPMGLRSPTVTVNPYLRPTLPGIEVDSAHHAHVGRGLALSGDGFVGAAPAKHDHLAANVVLATGPAGPQITSHSPNPVNARPQTLRITFTGSGLVSGSTYALSGPSGPQSGTCALADTATARCDVKPTTAGVHTMIITNPSGAPSNAYLFGIVDTLYVAQLPVLDTPDES